MIKQKMIKVSPEFHAKLVKHGQFGERFEDILIRLLGDKFMNTATGDRDTKTYSVEDVNSKKTKKNIAFIGKNPGKRAVKTENGEK